jgi:hypothetical protein
LNPEKSFFGDPTNVLLEKKSFFDLQQLFYSQKIFFCCENICGGAKK